MKLRILKLHPNAKVPEYATDGAACFDLHALNDHNRLACAMFPGGELLFRTGLAFEIPTGMAMLIFSRSGHGFNNDIRLANCVGVIDSDYRGEVMVKLRSDQPHPDLLTTDPDPESTFTVFRPGDRIAQAMLVPIPRVTFEVAEQLSITERGEGGFGSTGAA